MATRTYNYKDKTIIFAIFNESQSLFREFEELKAGNSARAIEKLNTAGTKLYQAYELGLKCYLDRRYKELYDNREMNWRNYDALRKTIEIGRYSGNRMVDVRYLLDQMSQYAEPQMTASNVDFDLIKNNAWSVNNSNKHSGENVDVEKYKQSYAEVRKFIIVYLDPNPPIQVIESPQFVNLLEACDYWSKESRFDYCLIADASQTNLDVLKKLMYVNWALVFDFDSNSESTGLSKAFSLERHIQPNRFRIDNPEKTEINSLSKIPYWFYANGLSDLSESLVNNERQWRQKYGNKLTECIKNYHAAFSKPLKVIVQGGPVNRVRDIINALDSIYDEGGMHIYLLSSEVQFEQIKEEYEDVLESYPLSVEELSSGINNYSALFGYSANSDGHTIISKEGRVDINPEEFSMLEILYYGIADDSNGSEEITNPELFYQGRCPLSWYGVKNEFAINRVVQYRTIKKKIQDAAIETTSRIIELRHDPGAGGTTLSRMIAYELSKEMPVVIASVFSESILSKQIENLYRKVRMSILIVVESASISNEDLSRLIDELMAHAVPHVILHVERIKQRADRNDTDVLTMTDLEFEELYKKLENYMAPDQKESIHNVVKKPSDRYPFYISLYTFEEQFLGVTDYIRHYMVEIKESDLKVLTYISLVDKFANRNLDVNFFSCFDESDPLGVFVDDVNKALVVLEPRGRNNYIRIRHARFAEEIIDYCLGGSNVENIDKATKLSEIVRDFIRYSKRQIMYDLDSTVDILKNLLILRDADSLVRNRFAPLITYIMELIPRERNEDRYSCIGVIFKELVDVYPEEAHFKAHLSRYYTHIEENYLRGIEEAKGALALAEEQDTHDPLLYHIAGMSIRRYVEKILYKDALDSNVFGEGQHADRIIEDIQKYLREASSFFEAVRATNNKVAGYISDIEMCIDLIDFAKRFENCTTEQLLNEYKDSWFMEYYDRALTLLEGFKNLRVEEETEFNQIRLSVRTSESLRDMISSIEATVSLWESYLGRASYAEKPVVRRFIARARQKTIVSDKVKDADSVNYILNLMEENITQEPENGANMRIWFNALRYCDNTNPEILLDDAINKLAAWKRSGDNYEAYYYYFILVCIKAIEGSSRAEAIIPGLQEELKNKTSHMPNNRVIYEWLGVGKGVGRLINAYSQGEGNDKKLSIDEIEEKGERIVGRISKYTSDRSAQIRAYNMEVFFSPSMQQIQATQEDINKKVRFILGFSYDGLRALNRSVELTSNDEATDESLIGKIVRCTIQGLDRNMNFLKVKLVEYSDTYGSIHKSEADDGDDIRNYVNEKFIYAKVVDKKYNSNENRVYLQLSLKTNDSLDDWQKKLKDLVL